MKRKAFLLTLVMMMAGMTGCGAKELALVSDRVEVELGSELDTTVTKYVDLGETAAADVSIDFSAVDVLAVGTYMATVISGDQTAEFEVDVVDTTAPAVEVLEDVKVAAGMPLYAKDVITDITELSGNAEVKFTVATSQQEDTAEATESVEEETETAESTELPVLEETFKLGDVTCQNAVTIFEEVGEYEVSVIVADASGNETTVPVRVIVGDVPVFSGIEDLTVALGTDVEEVDYLDGVTAVDCNGNDLTEDIVCDSSAVDLATAGEYDIVYTVTDENGFSAEQTATVTVEEQTGKKDTSKKNTSGKSNAKSDAKKNDSAAGTGGNAGNNNSGTSANVNASSGNTSTDTGSLSADVGNSSTPSADAGNVGNNSSTGADTGNTSAPSTDAGSTSTPSADAGSAGAPSAPSTPSTDSGSTSTGSEMSVPESGFGTGELPDSMLDNTDTSGGGDGGDVTWGGSF